MQSTTLAFTGSQRTNVLVIFQREHHNKVTHTDALTPFTAFLDQRRCRKKDAVSRAKLTREETIKYVIMLIG